MALHKKVPGDWLALKQFRSETSIRVRARKLGIKDEDLYLLYTELDNDLWAAQTFVKFFSEKKIHSVLFLSSYYTTRRHRFYFNLSLSGSETAVYVQPSEKKSSIYGWWKKTTNANYFLGEYLRMGWYLFNKILWTSAV